ncbi:MAG: radical SAM protein [Thermodesulfovibrionales bacterium]
MYSPARHIGQVFWKNRPIHLTFFVTRRCNARCPFCFYLRSRTAPPRREELSLEEIEEVSASLGSLLWLAFSGGEVFMREDIVPISRAFYENNRPAVMLYPTNGLLPDVIRERVGEILRICTKSTVAVKLSLDGVAEAHDALRNTPGSFGKTMETYRLLGELVDTHPHFELGVNTVFCSGNQDAMDGIIDFVQGLKKVTTHTISLVRGSLADESFKEVESAQYHRAIARLRENLMNKTSPIYRFRGARIKAAQDILQRCLIHRTREEGRRLLPCYAGRLNLVLGESGDVHPCEIRADTFGNVREYGYDMLRVCRSGQAKRTREEIRTGGCYCTHECYFMTNILFNPRFFPSLLHEYLRLR